MTDMKRSCVKKVASSVILFENVFMAANSDILYYLRMSLFVAVNSDILESIRQLIILISCHRARHLQSSTLSRRQR
jgi:hypothetical protein